MASAPKLVFGGDIHSPEKFSKEKIDKMLCCIERLPAERRNELEAFERSIINRPCRRIINN